jgi:hypothetical protein
MIDCKSTQNGAAHLRDSHDRPARTALAERGAMPVWALVLMDVLLIACTLVAFALFHHVLPRAGQAAQAAVTYAATSPSATPTAAATSAAAVAATDTASETTSSVAQAVAEETPTATDGAVGGDDTASSQAADDTSRPWAAKFADYFTDEIVSTDTTYSSPDIAISIEKKTMGSGSSLVTYYVADVHVASIECLRT